MKTMSNSPARGRYMSRTFHDVTLHVGKSLFLPSARVPVVVQCLTPSQISAIPQDSVNVRVLGNTTEVKARSAIAQACGIFPGHKVGVVVKGVSALDDVTPTRGYMAARGVRFVKTSLDQAKRARYARKRTSLQSVELRQGCISVGRETHLSTTAADSNEGRLVTILDIIGKAYSEVKSYRDDYRNDRNNNGGGDLPPNRDIFFPPIDENKMADCTVKIKDDFFGCNDTCTIGDKSWNVTDFCLLMFLAFRRMHILKNLSRQPFCQFLQDKVFMGKDKLKVKNFNNYANRTNYQALERELSNMPFNLDIRLSQHNNPLFFACHEIGCAFHKSDYFDSLRKQRDSLLKFVL